MARLTTFGNEELEQEVLDFIARVPTDGDVFEEDIVIGDVVYGASLDYD